jgi:DNA mismatch endonuclease (patch repair protein)
MATALVEADLVEEDVSPSEPLVDAKRRALMARIKGKNTAPEMIVRKALHAEGLRFRLHDKRLPGTPDLVFGGRRHVVFIHGCFWHCHPGCKRATVPRTRRAFWEAKLAGNIARDARDQRALETLGWRVHVVWECEIKHGAYLKPLVAALRVP